MGHDLTGRPESGQPQIGRRNGRRLIENLAGRTLMVLDFEYTTPYGAAPEPIEVAVQTLSARDGALQRGWSWEALIQPPSHAPLTPFDTNQTGITAAMLADRPPASHVLAELDARIDPDAELLLVAHNAPAEARILHDHREHCPRLARTELLDTVRLARDRYPELPHHTLDDLAGYLGIAVPPNRHRAMPDVTITLKVLIKLIEGEVRWPDLRTLRAVAGVAARAAEPEQETLFG